MKAYGKGIPLGMSIAEKIAYLDKARADDAEHFAHCVAEWWPQIRAGFTEPVSISEKAVAETLLEAICEYRFPASVAIDHDVMARLEREAQAYAKAIAAVLPLQEHPVPAGWKLVPETATQAMLDEVCCDSPYPTIVARDDVMQSIWRDMLNAAPEAK
jgi:hypothetical protein